MSASEGQPVRPPLMGALVAAVTLGVHARALDAPFVWDDRLLILRSPLVSSAQPLSAYFRAPFWNERFEDGGVRAFFRPLVTLSYRLDYLLGGPTPFGFHLTNVVLHAAVATLVFAWVHRLGANVLASALAAALWALEPRLTESVSWISGRTDVLALGLMLAAMLAWPEGSDRPARRDGAWRAVASALLLLALLAKEVAIAGAVAIGAVEWARSRRWREALPAIPPLGVAVGSYALLRWNALHETPSPSAGALSTPWYLPFSALGTYAGMTVDPEANAQIGSVLHPSVPAAFVGALLAAAALYAGWRVFRARDVPLAGPVCVATVGTLLVVHLLPLPVRVVACDRYLYVPLAGLTAVAAVAATRASRKVLGVSLALGGAAAVLLGALTVARIDDWRDELRFWVAAARGAPRGDFLPLGELANVLYRAKDYTDASPLYRVVAEHDEQGGVRRSLANLAACLSMLGRYDDSLAVVRSLADAEPANPLRHFGLGLVHLHTRRFDLARAAFRRALSLAPDYEEARAALALTEEAEAAWPEVSSRAPGDPLRARWLARIAARVEAVSEYRAAVDGPTASPRSVLDAAGYAVEEGDVEDAEAFVAKAEQLARSTPELPALERVLEEREDVRRRILGAMPEIRGLLGRFETAAPHVPVDAGAETR